MAETLHQLHHHADVIPDTIAFRDDDGEASYGALLRRVGAMAHRAEKLPDILGVLGANSIDHVVADLGCKWAGKTVVPLPGFFSPTQLGHVVRDAGIEAVIATDAMAPVAADLGKPVIAVDDGEASPPPIASNWRMIAYSSGTTGQPKGVVLGDRQIDHVSTALARAIAAVPGDSYLSVMPLALLLEQVAAIHVPLIVGGRSVFSASLPAHSLRGDGDALADTVAMHRPSVLSLVPNVLAAWVSALQRRGQAAPNSLRFVAVGGAPVPAALARAALARGIPIHEGYGLTECGSVVAVNRLGERRDGTVGRPLDGIALRLVDGEIVVAGDTVMDGYLGREPADRVWHTGDLGEIDADGNLIVHGRKDAVLVTALGRNVSPEWIEAMIQIDSRVAQCVLVGDGGPWPVAVVELSRAGRAWLSGAAGASLESLIWELTASAPDYARPRRAVLAAEGALANAALLTANGRPRRGTIAQRFRVAIDRAGASSSHAGSSP